MTTYGTIPTSSPTPEFISTAKSHLRSTLTTSRPWKQFFSVHSLSLPSSLSDALNRTQSNLHYFRTNYTIIILISLFLSLLWHPISLIVFTLTMVAWLFLYFLRDSPLLILHRRVDDRIVLVFLAVLTVALLLLTDVTVNVGVAIAVGAVVVLAHAVFRRVDDLVLGGGEFDDEVGASESRVVYRATGGLGERLSLRDTASSSYSTS